MASSSSGNAKRYSRQFRLQAAKLVIEGGYSNSEAARRLGTTSWSVRNWVAAFRRSGELPSSGQVASAADENRQLRKELAELRIENDILKKAAAYFAKESL
jgi:transposase